jgi:FkbM family methyltransferase
MIAAVKSICRPALRAITANASARGALRSLTQAGVLPAGIWKRLPVSATFPVQMPDGATFQYTATPYDTIGRALYWSGLKVWEGETTSVFYRLAREADTVLDIGANTGVFALIAGAANPCARVIAFEPAPNNFAKLEAHIRLNGWEDRCQARREAVSNACGVAQFHLPFGEVPTSASLHVDGFRGAAGRLIEVPMTTIDTVAAEVGKIDLIKIDVEGFEDKALEGMQRVLADSRPDLIVECNPDGPYREVEAILARFGYRFFHLRAQPVPQEHILPDETQRCRNYLCTTRPDRRLLAR